MAPLNENEPAPVEGPSETPPGGAIVPHDGRIANPVDVYLASLSSEDSRKSARDCLKRVLRVLEKDPELWREATWWTLRPEHTTAIRARLARDFGPATARLTLSILRGVLRQCFITGRIDGDVFQRVSAWGPVRGQAAPVGRMLEKDEIARLRGACERGGAFRGALDAALLACGFGAGLRRDEIARLDVGDLSDDGRSLRVRGKGAKVRIQPLPPWAGGAIEAWLAQRARFPLECKRMFVVILGRRVRDRGLSRWQVWQRLRDLGRRAEVSFTPHDMRRTYASKLLDSSGLATVQNLMGHSDPRTTVKYDRRPETAKRAAVAALEGWGEGDVKKK